MHVNGTAQTQYTQNLPDTDQPTLPWSGSGKLPHQGDLVLQPLFVRLRSQEQIAKHAGLNGHMRAHFRHCVWLMSTLLLALARKIYYVPLHGFHRVHCHAERLERVDGVACRLVHHEKALGSTGWK
ncbi:unnamed protein product [Alternaria alternata]